MGTTFYFDWEISLITWLQAHCGAFGAALASFFTLFGEGLVIVGLLGFLYWALDKKTAKFAGITALVSTVWSPMVKNVFSRRRPYFDNPEVKCLRPVEADADLYNVAAQGYSFPSGHSSGSAAAYGALAFRYRKPVWTVLGIVLPLLVGISRCALGVHYPTDVLCGWLLGLFCIAAVQFLQKHIRSEAVLYLLFSLLCLPGVFYCTSTDYFSSYGLMVGAFAGFLFEDRFVRFENTRSIWRALLRTVGGAAVFLIVSNGLKLPFSPEFLESETLGAHLVRTARYAVTAFLAMGVYPLAFRKKEKAA